MQKLVEHQAAVVNRLKMAGVEPEHIFAFRITNKLLTDDAMHNVSAEEKLEWQDAVDIGRHLLARGVSVTAPDEEFLEECMGLVEDARNLVPGCC